MNYKIIKNFLNSKECENLIKEAQKKSSFENYQKIHNNRFFLTCSNAEFRNLCTKSVNWRELEKKLASEDFFEFCCKTLNLNKDKFEIFNYFKNTKKDDFQKKIERIGFNQLKNLNTSTIIKFTLFRSIRRFLRKIKFSKFFFPLKKPIELLYDYSVAGDGYTREIHRDSDSRLIVFLIYLNTLEAGTKGGNLEIFKLKNKNDWNNSAKPSRDECEIIDDVIPEAGKLVIFQNGDDSFHSVSKIEKAQNKRHFIYGGFTLLNGKNPYITNKSVLKTEFHLYE
ncbi:2OG-Fe(II) oxygenase [Candidatus Pelagibacter sp.]|nr:2OG-Fe(II) oxygenase [Candidatus Pelagibacter sp.]